MSDNVEILIKKAAEIATQQNQLINYKRSGTEGVWFKCQKKTDNILELI